MRIPFLLVLQTNKKTLCSYSLLSRNAPTHTIYMAKKMKRASTTTDDAIPFFDLLPPEIITLIVNAFEPETL